MSHEDMITRLTRAAVPRSCWGVSTTGTGRARYRDFVGELKQRHANREQQTVAYLHYFDSRCIIDVEMFAKETVLAGLPTRYTTFYKLARDLRMAEAHGPEHNPLEAIYGRGALVLPDIPLAPDSDVENIRIYHEAVEYLVNHAYDGGILILGGTVRLDALARTAWPVSLARLLTENSRLFEVRA